MEEIDDAFMVVAEIYCRYKSPAYYEDVLTVRTMVAELRSRSLRFIYEVRRASDDMLIAEGETLHLVTDKNKKIRSLPDVYRTHLLESEEQPLPAQAPS
jgi:acyl-CoA thioester hydrolase